MFPYDFTYVPYQKGHTSFRLQERHVVQVCKTVHGDAKSGLAKMTVLLTIRLGEETVALISLLTFVIYA